MTTPLLGADTADVGDALVAALKVAAVLNAGATDVINNAMVANGNPPFVKFRYLGSDDEEVAAGRAFAIFTYEIVVVSAADGYDDAVTIARIIDGILQRGTLNIANGVHDTTWRTSPIERPSYGDEGEMYWNIGGNYRIGVRPE